MVRRGVRADCRSERERATAYDEQMGSTTFGEAGSVAFTGLATPQDIDANRGADGRVRVSDRN
jgi:hypothetical protein